MPPTAFTRGRDASQRPRYFAVRSAMLFFAALLAVPAAASAATVQATPSTLSSVYSAAKAGDTIELAAGSYGTFTAANKSGMVTLLAPSGVSATMSVKLASASYLTVDGLQISSLNLSGSSHDITVRNSTVNGQAYFNMSGNSNANILIDRNTFKPWDAGSGDAEGRLHITQPGALGSTKVGVTVSNNLFQGPGCSDGIQIGAYGVVVGPGNTFTGIKQGSCSAHVDSIQLYGQSHTTISGNYFTGFTTAIMAPDGGNTEIITNNVIDSNANSTNAVQFGSFKSSTFSHNTVRGTSVNMDHKSGESNSSGGIITDNIMVNGNFNAASSVCTSCTVDHNLFSSSGNASGTNSAIGTPTFTGGTNPTTYAGFALATGSAGKGTATDGTDRGVNVDGGGGTVDPPPADTTAPDTTISSGPSGTIATDSGSFAFTSSESGSTFECKLDSGSFASCTSPKAYSNLGEGSHTFSVRATDAAGNVDASPASRTFTVSTAPPADTTAPDTTIGSGPGASTTDTTPSFSFAATESGSTFQCKVDSGSWATCASPYTTATLALGSHTFSVRATDAAGNTDASPATSTFTVAAPADTTAPDTTIASGPSGTTSDATPTFAFTSSESGGTFQCKVDSGSWSTCTSPKTLSALADGAHTFSVRARDAAGNTDASPATRTFTVDTTPADTTAPDTTIGSGPSGTTNAATPTFAFDATEPGTFQCQVDGGSWSTCASPETLGTLADGDHTFSVRATDAAGNTDASPATSAFTVDTHAPRTTITSAPLAATIGGSASLAFTADDDAATFECRLDEAAWAPCASPVTFSGLGLGSHTASVRATDAAGNVEAPGPGVAWLTVEAPTLPPTDTTPSTPDTTTPDVPNVPDTPDVPDVPDTPDVPDAPDTTPPPAPTGAAPTLALTEPATGTSFTSKLRATAKATDADGIAKVEFWIDRTRIAVDKGAPYTTTYSAPKSLSYGTHTLSVRAFDRKGAVSSVAVAVTRVRSTSTTARKSAATARAWRIASASVDGVTVLDGLASAGHQQTVTYTRCSDASGKVLGRQKVRSDATGKVSGTLPAAGACVLKVS